MGRRPEPPRDGSATPRGGGAYPGSALRRVARPVEDTLRGALRRVAGVVRYRLERFVVGGVQSRLALVAGLIGIVAVAAGAVVAEVEDASAPEAIWWAFLRLTDPGYLGEDQGILRRTVSTALTVAGYVLFMGALVAILTTSLDQAIDRLESGLTPIARSGHVLVVGWNSRTVTILRELFESDTRVRRFLALHRARSLVVCLLADAVTSRLRHELRARLGPLWRDRRTILRSGSPLVAAHLDRADFAHAAAIILPAGARTHVGVADADAATIKAVLSISTHGLHATGTLPSLVCEVLDGRKARIARRAYRGEIDVVATDQLLGALLAQNVRHPGLSRVYGDLLTHVRGRTLYARDVPELAGMPFGRLAPVFREAILLGVARPKGDGFDAVLAPDPTFVTRADDRYVLLADHSEDTAPTGEPGPPVEAPAPRPAARPAGAVGHRRLLVLGFNHKVPALLTELARQDEERVDVVLVSASPKLERRNWMRGRMPRDPVHLDWIRGDRTLPETLTARDPASFDTILLTSGDRFDDPAEADAETVATYLLLRDLLDAAGSSGGAAPHVVVELMDGPNRALFADEDAEVVVTPLVVGRVLAQVTLRRELKPVYDELLGPLGAEFDFRPPAAYGLDPGAGPWTFAALRAAVGRTGDVLAGIHDPRGPNGGAAHLDPAPESRWALDAGEALVVVTERR